MRISPAAAPQFRVGQFNVENFFDTADDPHTRDTVVSDSDYKLKLEKLSRAIRDDMAAPDMVAVEEVENQHVLEDLIARPELQGLGYKALLLSGNDSRGINVGMLYREGSIEITGAKQENPNAAQLPDPHDQLDPTALFARPPLVVDAVWHAAGGASAAAEGQKLTLIVNHFKSKMGGPVNDTRREEQASFVASLVDARTAADPKSNVLVLGDLNTNEDEQSFSNLAKHADGSVRLTSATAGLDPSDRYSWGRPNGMDLFDHVLVTAPLASALTGAQILHFDTTASKSDEHNPRVSNGVSDHDPIVASFDLSKLATA